MLELGDEGVGEVQSILERDQWRNSKRVVGKLSKLGDAQIDAALGSAADELRGRVQMALDAAQQKLDSAAGKVKPAKVQKQIDSGVELLDRAAAEENIKKVYGFLAKAEARARKGDKLAGKVKPSGDGCPGNPITANETITLTKDGAPFPVTRFNTFLIDTEFDKRTVISFFNCDAEQSISVTLPLPATVGSYFGGSITPSAGSFARCGGWRSSSQIGSSGRSWI